MSEEGFSGSERSDAGGLGESSQAEAPEKKEAQFGLHAACPISIGLDGDAQADEDEAGDGAAAAKATSFTCGACGQEEPLSDNITRASHGCKFMTCGKDLHSYIKCDALWMPQEGVYFCGLACLRRHNSCVEAEVISGPAYECVWRSGKGKERPPVTESTATTLLTAAPASGAGAASVATPRVGTGVAPVATPRIAAVSGEGAVDESANAGLTAAEIAEVQAKLPAAVSHLSTVRVRVDGKWYQGRCCDSAAGTTIAFPDGDWRHLSTPEAICALSRGDIVAAAAAAADCTEEEEKEGQIDVVDGFTFTTGYLGRPPRVGGCLVGRHSSSIYGLDGVFRAHYLCLRSFEHEAPPADAPRTRKRGEQKPLDRQGLRTFRFGDVVYEASPAPDTEAAAAAVAAVILQPGERNPDTNKMGQARRILLLKELPIKDSKIPFFAGSWKKWERRLLDTPANASLDVDDASAAVEMLTADERELLSCYLSVALETAGSAVGKLVYKKTPSAAEHQMKNLPPLKSERLIAAEDEKKKAKKRAARDATAMATSAKQAKDDKEAAKKAMKEKERKEKDETAAAAAAAKEHEEKKREEEREKEKKAGRDKQAVSDSYTAPPPQPTAPPARLLIPVGGPAHMLSPPSSPPSFAHCLRTACIGAAPQT